jgi:hypothetical protein
MTPVWRSTTLSVSIERPPRDVYAFVSNPENLPKWAAGLGRSVRRAGGEWIVEMTDGPVRFEFVAPNEHGVLDHYVRAPGLEVLNPMRVVANGSGSEVLFTVFQLPGMSDEKYGEDVRLVEADLRTLKKMLDERSSGI